MFLIELGFGRLHLPGIPAVLFITVLVSLFFPGRGLSQVVINRDGVLVVDGEKVLPIGFSNGPPPDGRTPDGRSAFSEIKDAGGTFFRTGVRGSERWDQAIIEREQIWMDAAA